MKSIIRVRGGGRRLACSLGFCKTTVFYPNHPFTRSRSKFIWNRIQKATAEGRRCHAKTMMNTKPDKAQTWPVTTHHDRSWCLFVQKKKGRNPVQPVDNSRILFLLLCHLLFIWNQAESSFFFSYAISKPNAELEALGCLDVDYRRKNVEHTDYPGRDLQSHHYENKPHLD